MTTTGERRARGGKVALAPSCRAPYGHDQILGHFFFPDLRRAQVEQNALFFSFLSSISLLFKYEKNIFVNQAEKYQLSKFFFFFRPQVEFLGKEGKHTVDPPPPALPPSLPLSLT